MSPVHRSRVHGRVQGVGFRYFVMRRARELGVAGWVRNRTDGTVEALVWAEGDTYERLLAVIREGPRFGRVDRLEVVVERDPGDRPSGFGIRSDR